MKDRIARLHPIVILCYYLCVSLYTVFVLHPALQAAGFFCAALTLFYFRGIQALRTVSLALLLALVSALFNMLFNHLGVSVLFYLGDSPVTAEALLYGLCTGMMMGGILLWSSLFGLFFKADKLLFLLKRAAPSIAVLLCLCLRLVPDLRRKGRQIREGRQGLFGTASGGLFSRLRAGAENLSALTTRALEDGVDTAASMTARGYGLPGRTAFPQYRFTPADGAALTTVALCLAGTMLPAAFGRSTIEFYPLWNCTTSIESVILYVLFFCLPLLLTAKEWVDAWLRGALPECREGDR